MTPRKYQLESFQSVKTYLEYRSGNPCVVLPTAAGKTIVIALLCQWVAGWGGRVLILAHVKELLQQAADKLNAMAPELHVGIYSAGLDRRETTGQITVAGIQSVYQKADAFEPFDLVIVDECHLLQPEGDGMYRTFLSAVRERSPHCRLVGLTATPYRMTTGALCGPDELLTAVCHEVAVMDLIEQGFLSKLISKNVTDCDTSQLHIRGGEFVADEVALLMGGADTVRKAVNEIIERTQDRKSVLIFCSGVKHAEDVATLLPGAEIVTGETPNRDQILDRFKRGQTKYLVNISVLTTGFDAPNIDCVVMLRPTLSAGLYCQMVGRGFRLCDGKENCLVLDFSGNISRHGPLNHLRIEKKRRGKPTGEAATKVCPECDEVLFVSTRTCPSCGHAWPLIEDAKHDHRPGSEDIIADDVTENEVFDVRYRKHHKKGADPDDPTTMRVEYILMPGNISAWMKGAQACEWVCLEHTGFARQKAELWWAARSNDPAPTTTDRAVDMADGGSLAVPLKIWTRPDPQNPKYTRIVKVELGPKPDAAPVCESCGGAGCDECKFEFANVTESVFDIEDVPF